MDKFATRPDAERQIISAACGYFPKVNALTLLRKIIPPWMKCLWANIQLSKKSLKAWRR